MEGKAAQRSLYREWRLLPTGRKMERSVPFDRLEVHPEYPHHLERFTNDDIQRVMFYIMKEGAPPHRIYVTYNILKPGYYFIIGWLEIYEAYKRLGISDLIPSLCYLDVEAHKQLWKNWKNRSGEIFDVK